MKKILWILPLFALLAVACGGGSNGEMPWEDDLGTKPTPTPTPGQTIAVGDVLPDWEEGCFDIHFINSGRGECCFYIFPDGTTMLVDAGELTLTYGDGPCPQRPNSSIRPYETYARYIKHFLPQGQNAIDYCAPSHFHIDHIGQPEVATETSPVGYRKAGLLALFDLVPYSHVIDNAYPGYVEDDVTAALDGGLAEDWGKFVTWGVKEGKFTGARFTPGTEQMVMLYNKDAHKDFKVFNICANGFVWAKNGQGNGYLGGKKSDKGNPSCCGFHVTYGKFDYVACGDLTSTSQNLFAAYYRDFIGDAKLDAFKTHHHLGANSWGSKMQEYNFNPRVVLNCSMYQGQPNPDMLNNVLNNVAPFPFWVKDFFTTNGHENAVAANRELYNKVAGYNGHIVLRVAKGGDTFNVYMLDDTNFEYRVKSIHGPYTSR